MFQEGLIIDGKRRVINAMLSFLIGKKPINGINGT
jgi:hypothetical protein